MELKNIVLHHIKREENQTPVLNTSDHLLDRNNTIVKEFVEKLVKSFGSKNPTYGAFQEDVLAYPFQTLVATYRVNKDFLTFSVESMKLLEKEIQVPQAKGGYVVFIHYEQNGIEFLITIMLDKAEQFTINDESLDIKKLKTLDIDKLARANRINFNKFESGIDLYLAFIKGTRDVSSYFQKFIGNTDLTSSKKNSQNL
jgi:nucleoid-associated protein YejK